MTKEILEKTDHRPWILPSGNWNFYQEWNKAIFLHWQVDLKELQLLVPNELEIDLFEGKPWVSLVAFTMEKIRPRNLLSFSPISNFDEINIRTYVRSNTKTGVYFLSIEGGKRLSCQIAKCISGLPYRYSNINRGENIFSSSNSKFNDNLHIEFNINKSKIEKSPLDKWLTERYALFQDTKELINKFEIHHLEWSINDIEISDLQFQYPRFDNLIQGSPTKVQYSKGVKVIAWNKENILRSDINSKI